MKNSEYPETRKSILQNDRTTLNIAHLKRDIAKQKAKLSKKRIHENFGQNEVRALQDRFSNLLSDYWSDDSNEARRLLRDFEDWATNYEG